MTFYSAACRGPTPTFSIIKAALAASIITASACRKPMSVDTAKWTTLQQVAQSRDSLISDFSLHKWNNSLMALSSDDGLKTYFMQEDEKTWKPAASGPVICLPLSVDPKSNRWLAVQGAMSTGAIQVDFQLGSVSSENGFVGASTGTWRGNLITMFGKVGANVSFGGVTDKPLNQPFWNATFSGSDLCVPYWIRGETIRGRGIIASEGPFDCGVFWSSDSGQTWTREHIDASPFVSSSVCKTVSGYYFIAGRTDINELRSFRKTAHAWTKPSRITTHFANDDSAVAEEDTVHVCWLDRRNEKRRSSSVYPWRNNYEVAYCNQKESDTAWSEPILISQGLLYAFRPVMSVEGNNIVIAWAGVDNAPDGHHESAPNDIFYATSKDGGKTWAKPKQVTNGFKAGLTSGRPQVALHKGVIHLFYIQGKLNFKKVSTGMVKLNQPPWPIYYQRRPFPN